MLDLPKEWLEEIRSQAKILHRTPTQKEMPVKRKYPGGWNYAVRLAGLFPYNGSRMNQIRSPANGDCYSDEELIAFVREAAAETGKIPSRGMVPEFPYIEYRFGHWPLALKKMGFDIEVPPAQKPKPYSGYRKQKKQKDSTAKNNGNGCRVWHSAQTTNETIGRL